MSEHLNENKMKKMAERYYEKYRDQMDALDHSILAKARGGSPSSQDYYALGAQLEQYDEYQAICEEEGNIGQLGKIPQIAYDVITAVQAVSIIPVISSVQPIEEERGTVYFKTIRSATKRGSQNVGNVVTDPRSGIVTPSGYSSAYVQNEVGASTGAVPVAPFHYQFTLANAPVRPQAVTIALAGVYLTTIYCQDNGTGVLLGTGQLIGGLYVGMSGTINYTNGLVDVYFTSAPPALTNILATYETNFETNADLPLIDTYFDSKPILARIYALKGTIGLLQAYGMRKRFGLIAEDEIAKDIVTEVNKEIGGDLVRKLFAAQMGNTQWSKTPPANISYFEHKQTFKDYLARAEAIMLSNAGRGTITCIIGGRDVCAIIQTLPGWTKLTDGNTLGNHVYGTLDGVTVIRVPESNLLAANKAILMWKGTSPFDTAAIYAPFMPLTVTATLPTAPNPLRQMKAAAVWAGVDVVVPNYITGFEVTP